MKAIPPKTTLPPSAATGPPPGPWDDPDLHRALNTALEWRRDAAIAVDLLDGSLVEANRPGQELRGAANGAGSPSRSILFSGKPLRLVAETLGQRDPVANIPSLVIDLMLRSIVEAHFAVWYVWHVPTGAIYAPGMRELLAIPESEVPTIVEEWLGRVHPDDLPRMVAENDLSLRTNSAFRSEYRFRHGQGGYISISDWGIVLPGEDGRAEWMAGGLRDITLEKHLAQAREEAARLREVLFTKSLIPTFLLDGNGVFLDASQSALAFLQVEREALVGRSGCEFLPAPLVEGIRASNQREAVRPDALGPMEVELRVAGRRKWLLSTLVPFSVGDARMAFVLAADVTETRRASEALARSEASLRDKKEALERHNVALRVLIDQRRSDFTERQRILTENLEQLVFPILDRIAAAFSDREEVALLDVVRQTLQDVANPLLESRDRPLERSQGMSRREWEILQLVRAGRTTEEIARALYIAPATVTFHRCNIRRKLGLHGSGLRLTPRVDVKAVLHPQDPPVVPVRTPIPPQ